jgi:hypothetical protein
MLKEKSAMEMFTEGFAGDWRLKTRWGCFSDLFWFAFALEKK